MNKKHYAARDFSDAGTERNFAAGEHVDVSEAELANYRAAGLVNTDGPQEPEAAAAEVTTTTAAPAKPKRTRKSSKTLN
jgi:hypothetical protein